MVVGGDGGLEVVLLQAEVRHVHLGRARVRVRVSVGVRVRVRVSVRVRVRVSTVMKMVGNSTSKK